MHEVTNAQVNRLVEMRRKKYRIISVRFQPIEGHLTVGVRVKSRGKNATRFFFIGQEGKLQ